MRLIGFVLAAVGAACLAAHNPRESGGGGVVGPFPLACGMCLVAGLLFLALGARTREE